MLSHFPVEVVPRAHVLLHGAVAAEVDQETRGRSELPASAAIFYSTPPCFELIAPLVYQAKCVGLV